MGARGDYPVFKFVGNRQGHGTKKKKWALYHGRLFKVTLLNFLAQFSHEGAEVQQEQLLNKQPHEDWENA